MSSAEILRTADPAVVTRYLQIRGIFNDQILAPLEKLAVERYQVQLSRRITSTLLAQVRHGFLRPEEGDIWPVFFLTPVDITAAVCVQITSARLAGLGTMLNGPQRIRHRQWEDWWGWEKTLLEIAPPFFEMPAEQQQEVLLHWFVERLEWLANSGLLPRQARS
jgi:hypothetical protein